MKLVGERRAFASAVLGASFLVLLVQILTGGFGGVDEIVAIALSAGYGLAFLAVVAGYKLARPIGLAVLAIGSAVAGYKLLSGADDFLFVLGANAIGMISLLGKTEQAYIRLVGERRAVAAIVLAFYALLYAVLGLANGEPLDRMLYALGACYGVAFFALVAGYFWARWFGVGVVLFGVIQAAMGMWQVGPEPIVVFMAATHLAALFALWGTAMAVPYDGQTAWRERFHMDDSAVQRLGRAVIRAGVSLPMVLMYAFAPKLESEWVAVLTLVLAAGGLSGLIRMRTWGVLAMAASGALLLAVGGDHAVVTGELDLPALLGGGLMVSAVVPFARAIVAHLRAPLPVA